MSKNKKETEDKNLVEFLEGYKILTNRHGLMIAGELVYAQGGIFIKPVVIKKTNENDDSGKQLGAD